MQASHQREFEWNLENHAYALGIPPLSVILQKDHVIANRAQPKYSRAHEVGNWTAARITQEPAHIRIEMGMNQEYTLGDEISSTWRGNVNAGYGSQITESKESRPSN